MKKILFIVIFLISCAALSAQTGTGWTNMRAKYNFRDTININDRWKIGGTVITPSAAEINHLDGVTSAIQTQMDAKISDADARQAINDTVDARLGEAVVGVAVIDSIGGSSGNDYYATPDYVQGYIGSGGGGAFTGQILKFIIGVTTGAPTNADSIIIHSAFDGKQVDVFRNGDLHYLHTDATNTIDSTYRINGDTITVKPLWSNNERVEIRIREPNTWSYLALEGQESDLLDSLIVYYKLDETSGTSIADAQGGYTGVAGIGTTPTATNAKYNYARKIGYKSQLRTNSTDPNPDTLFSISMWIYADSLNSSDYLFCMTSTGTYTIPHRAYINTDSTITFRVRNSSGTEYESISDMQLDDSTLYHVVFVHRGNGKTNLIYIDGVDHTTNGTLGYTFTGDLYESNGYIIFGNRGINNSYNFSGTIDDIGLWHKILTPANVTELNTSSVTHPFE